MSNIGASNTVPTAVAFATLWSGLVLVGNLMMDTNKVMGMLDSKPIGKVTKVDPIEAKGVIKGVFMMA